MIVSIILLALGAVMSTIFIVSKVTNYSFTTIVLKTIASLFFVALAIYLVVTIPGHNIFKIFVLMGLIFGLLGDIFLGFKYITTKTKKLWIMLGMFAFALGHISYLVGLFLEYYVPGKILFIFLPFITACLLSSIYLVISRRLGVDFGRKLLPFALFYLFCLTSMFSTSLYMAILHNFSIVTSVMFFIGAAFFMTSDMMLTGAYFKAGERPKAYLAIYSICYYIAQFVIAFSLFFLI